MATTALDKELMDLERAFWDALQDKDARTAGKMTADSCIIVGTQGAMEMAPSSMESMMKEATYELKNYRIDPKSVHVSKVADNVAVLAYAVKEDLTVEGKPVSFEAFDSSVWVRKGDSWTCALHTETVAGDPFGRDKK